MAVAGLIGLAIMAFLFVAPIVIAYIVGCRVGADIGVATWFLLVYWKSSVSLDGNKK